MRGFRAPPGVGFPVIRENSGISGGAKKLLARGGRIVPYRGRRTSVPVILPGDKPRLNLVKNSIILTTLSLVLATTLTASAGPPGEEETGFWELNKTGFWSLNAGTSVWNLSNEGTPFMVWLERTLTDIWGFEISGVAGISYVDINDIRISQNTNGAVEGGTSFGVMGQFVAQRRIYSVNKWDLFLEIGGGGHYSSQSFPADGTHFNFLVVGGLEVAYNYSVDRAWQSGLRWTHSSNANMQPNNSGYDGIMLHLGHVWRF